MSPADSIILFLESKALAKKTLKTVSYMFGEVINHPSLASPRLNLRSSMNQYNLIFKLRGALQQVPDAHYFSTESLRNKLSKIYATLLDSIKMVC